MNQRMTIAPSLIVARSISRVGGVATSRNLVKNEVGEDGHEHSEWEVSRDVENPEEVRRVSKLIAQQKRVIDKLCARTSLGLLCPKVREPLLLKAIEEVRARVAEENDTLTTCEVTAAFVRGEIVSDEREAAAQIARDIGAAFSDIKMAIAACDVKAIRKAVLGLKGLDAVLPDVQAKALKDATLVARKAATLIAREVDKKGRTIESVRQSINMDALDVARIAFVEVGDSVPVVEQTAPEVVEHMASLEIDEAPEPGEAAKAFAETAPVQPAIEF